MKKLPIISFFVKLYENYKMKKKIQKKLEELKCYCNVDECMELLSQPLITENFIKLNKTYFGLYFSVKYKDMFMKYYSNIKEYFKMVRLFDHKKKLWVEKNKDGVNIPSTHTLSWLDNTNSIPQEYLNNWAKFNDIIWTLEPKKYDKPNKNIMNINNNAIVKTDSIKKNININDNNNIQTAQNIIKNTIQNYCERFTTIFFLEFVSPSFSSSFSSVFFSTDKIPCDAGACCCACGTTIGFGVNATGTKGFGITTLG